MDCIRVGIVGLNVNAPYGEGVANSIKEMARELGKIDNVSVIIITNNTRKMAKVETKGSVTRVKLVVPFQAHEDTLKYKINYFLFCLIISLCLPMLIKRYKINILHFHLWLTPFYIWFGLLCKAIKIPILWTMYTPAALDKAMIPKKFILKIFKRIICVNRFCGRMLASYNVLDNVVYIPVPIDVKRFSPYSIEKLKEYRKKLKLPENRTLILYTGPFLWGRGVHILLKAYNSLICEVPSLRTKSMLILASSGINADTYYSAIEKYVEQKSLKDNVLFLGYQNAIEELYAVIDVMVFPLLDTRYVISTPMTVLEAMASEKKVIATKIGSIDEVIKDRENGFLIQPHDLALLKKLLEELTTHPDKYMPIQKSARKTVLNDYASNNVSKKLLDVYIFCIGDYLTKPPTQGS